MMWMMLFCRGIPFQDLILAQGLRKQISLLQPDALANSFTKYATQPDFPSVYQNDKALFESGPNITSMEPVSCFCSPLHRSLQLLQPLSSCFCQSL